MELEVQTLTPEAFAPYGHVVRRPERASDAEGPGWRWWAETALLAGDGRAMGVGFLDLEPGTRSFDWAERHLRTHEGVLAMSTDILLYVGPADPAAGPPVDRFEVFRIPAGTGVVLEPGVWHGAPFAIDRAGTTLILILEGTGTTDVEKVPFDAIDIVGV